MPIMEGYPWKHWIGLVSFCLWQKKLVVFKLMSAINNAEEDKKLFIHKLSVTQNLIDNSSKSDLSFLLWVIQSITVNMELLSVIDSKPCV